MEQLNELIDFFGDRNEYGQTYWRRNATFEPSRNPNEDWVDKCLKDISVAFRWGKPAVINSHRVNFSGGIDQKNRDITLKMLNTLLKRILQTWPNVEFVNSEQLGDIISKNNKKLTLSNVKNTVSDNLVNMYAYKTGRKIVVIESDDWGTIRMPSKKAYSNMLEAGVKVNECEYNSFDSLANTEDLSALYNILIGFRDKNKIHPIITANTIVANPNFEKIENANYSEYYYELFTETLKRYFPKEDVFNEWQKGIKLGVFHPQFHGREHLQVKRWLSGLKDGLPETILGFENSLFGLSTTITSENRKSYMAAYDMDSNVELEQQKGIIKDGLDIFESIFGYRSKSFIAPNYTWSSHLESFLKESGIDIIQGARAQRDPQNGTMTIKKYHTGKRNKQGQVFLIRNVTFEPSLDPNRDWIKTTLRQISNAFLWKTPAIISSHRLNYIGSLDKKNRDNNLLILEKLLDEILKRWPDVEFMTSDKLGEIIMNK